MTAEDQGGYWLSEFEEIRNPYFGEAMLTCGEVRETISNSRNAQKSPARKAGGEHQHIHFK
jgi:Cu(I)/Ag(I) efflux system membrane fusion protein